jgi:alkylation response protein AidB-like acyl-CoA dehydrogenase
MSGPQPASTSELGEFAAALDGYLAKAISSNRRRKLWESGRVDRELWFALGSGGWLAPVLPEDQGGMALELANAISAFWPAGRHLLNGPLAEHLIVLPLLLSAGASIDSLEQLAGGETILAFWDPQAHGRDAAELTVTLDPQNRVSGELAGLRFAHDADTVVMLVARDSEDVVVRIDLPAEGLTLRPTGGVSSAAWARRSRVSLLAVASTVLLDGARARRFADEVRAWLHLGIAYELSGAVAWMLDAAVEHAKVRQQFGSPIGSFQAIQHILADMAAADSALKNVCQATADDMAAARSDASLMWAANAFASKTSLSVAEDTLQVLGGIGFTTEHEFHMYFKHVLGLWAWYGDPAHLSDQLGRSALKQVAGTVSPSAAI